MRNRIASVLAGVALALSVGAVQAATYDVNLHGLLGSDEWSADLDYVNVAKKKSFNDTFNLLLSEDSNIWFGAAEIGRTISLYSVQLFDSFNNLVAVGQDFEFGWSFFNIAGEGLGPLLLEAGSYHFLVSGKNDSKKHSGFYKFGVLAQAVPPTPVPLPPAVFLLATGLAGLAGLARRRKTAAMEPVAA